MVAIIARIAMTSVQVILFAVDGAECEAEVVGRRPAEEEPGPPL